MKRFLKSLVLLPLLALLVNNFFLLDQSWNLGRKVWPVPPMAVDFGDLRSLTSGWDCVRKGVDPLLANPCDHAKRPMNYPRLWQIPGHISSLGESSTRALGVGMAALFMLCLGFWVTRMSWWGASLVGLSSLSPPVLLALERGNIDLLMFSMLAIGAFVPFGYSLLILAALLKLFPLGSLILLLRHSWKIFLLSCFALGLVWVFGFEELVAIRAGTPSRTLWAFGSHVFLSEFLKIAISHIGATAMGVFWGSLLFVVGFFLNARSSRPWRLPLSEIQKSGFLVFSGAFMLAYIIGNNFDYRLIFLVPVLGLGVEFLKRSWMKTVFAASIVFVLFYSPYSSQIMGLDELILFLYFSALCLILPFLLPLEAMFGKKPLLS